MMIYLYTRMALALTERRDRGASAVEYGLLVAAIAAVIVGVLFVFGNTISNVFNDTNTCVQNQGAGC